MLTVLTAAFRLHLSQPADSDWGWIMWFYSRLACSVCESEFLYDCIFVHFLFFISSV